MIRQPIVCVLGHVDHGKTTLLDSIRGSGVAEGEVGRITQHIGASELPKKVIEKVCGDLLEKMKIKLNIPGLLFIDTPGHEAFTTLRKRGGSIADLAVLVVDINEGFQPQTDESLTFLKEFKTPFLVAATKIDKIFGWIRKPKACFLESFKDQPERVKKELEEKIYKLVGELSERGFEAERFDRVSDFAKQVCIVPTSGISGEGIPELLVILCGLAQKYLKNKLEIEKGVGKGSVLEVKEFKGLGTTIDVILYDGEIKKGDYLVIGGTEKEKVIVTKIRALLKPEPLKELRVEKKFLQVDSVSAAAGIKISAPGLEEVIAGSPIRAVRTEKDLEKAKEEVEKEIEEIEIETEGEGVLVKTDTLGSLEALIKILKELNIPIRKAKVGNITKSDILEIKTLEEPIIFAFNSKILPEAEEALKGSGVKIFKSNIIYKIIEDYQEWKEEEEKKKEEKILESAIRPGKVKVLPGCVFRQSKPAIFGVEVLAGTIKPNYILRSDDKIIGEIKQIQLRGENVKEAKIGDKVAISMEGVTMGRQIKENDILEVVLNDKDLKILEKIKNKLREDEIELLEQQEEKLKKERIKW